MHAGFLSSYLPPLLWLQGPYWYNKQIGWESPQLEITNVVIKDVRKDDTGALHTQLHFDVTVRVEDLATYDVTVTDAHIVSYRIVDGDGEDVTDTVLTPLPMQTLRMMPTFFTPLRSGPHTITLTCTQTASITPWAVGMGAYLTLHPLGRAAWITACVV